MPQKILMTTGTGDSEVRYIIVGSEEMPNTNKVSYTLLALGKYDLPIGSCLLNVDMGMHSKDRPATYEIKQNYFKSNKICKFDEFVCNVFDCVEKFIDDREIRYCKVFGNFAYNKDITKKLTEKGYQINQKQIERPIYVPYYRTSQQRAFLYCILDTEKNSEMNI